MGIKIKTAVIYGDSISTADFGNGGYGKLIKEKLGIETLYNHAISASAMTDGTPNNLIRLLDDEANLHSDAELVIIWHGTNDWYWGAPIGEYHENGRQDENTFIGALVNSVLRIRKCAPTAKIVYLTPLWRYQNPDRCDKVAEAWTNKNAVGLTLCDYYNAIIDMSRLMCFPVIDMRTWTNFNRSNHSIYQPDLVHPSEEGYKIIADIICGHIKNFYNCDC